MFEDEVLNYHEYIQQKLAYLERYTTLIKDGNISPESINHALASYQSIGAWMISEYEKVSLDFDILKEEFQTYFDEWYLEASKKLNESRIKSKFASGTEIEATARVTHREDYLKWQARLKIMDRKVSLYRRLMDNWKAQKDAIVNLSQNSRAEMRSLGIQDLANYEEKPKIVKRIREKE
jgi:hypothetical protein